MNQRVRTQALQIMNCLIRNLTLPIPRRIFLLSVEKIQTASSMGCSTIVEIRASKCPLAKPQAVVGVLPYLLATHSLSVLNKTMDEVQEIRRHK